MNPGFRNALGIIENVLERAGAGFGHRAQRFFQNIRQAAFFISGRRIVVETAAELPQISLYFSTHAKSSRATARFRARRTSRCSAPKISVVSASTMAPPRSTIKSQQKPSAGFAVMPENESDPPQFSPSASF